MYHLPHLVCRGPSCARRIELIGGSTGLAKSWGDGKGAEILSDLLLLPYKLARQLLSPLSQSRTSPSTRDFLFASAASRRPASQPSKRIRPASTEVFALLYDI